MLQCVCKYTPWELLAGFGESFELFDDQPDDVSEAESFAHANLCGFGKALIERSLEGETDELVLVNCCDTMRRAYEVIDRAGTCSFLHLMDLPHCTTGCARQQMADQLRSLRDKLQEHYGRPFDLQACLAAFKPSAPQRGPYIGIMGVRAGSGIEQMTRECLPLPVRNLTCTGNRDLFLDTTQPFADEDAFFEAYAAALLEQTPCQRMEDTSDRHRLFDDPDLRGIVYHTMKFCDYYGCEYAEIKQEATVPMLKIETDYTRQSEGQLKTRVEAFAETIAPEEAASVELASVAGQFFAGIDSGSTSTDVVIMDAEGTIVATSIVPTGGGAQVSADACLQKALDDAGIPSSKIARTVATGYGRAYITSGDRDITEITCHAKGAHYLDPSVRSIIDIGGQDSKAIRLNEKGAVDNFVMNDKCAAGTGRFMEMMARTLGVDLDQMGPLGLQWSRDITISSMCTVFAESEVVSLVARNVAQPDIIHGLDTSVANKTAGLFKRVGADATKPVMMTGGVARNLGVVRAIEDKLGCKLVVSEYSQLCGAIGAALYAVEG